MKISETLLPEFDHEMATTRKLLERVPADKFGWKPHDRSTPMGKLAAHLAGIPGWTRITLEQDSLDLAVPGQPFAPETTAAVLQEFDKTVAEGRASLQAADDAAFFRPWSLMNGGQTLMTMPKAAILRGFVLNHLIHHRGQLSVYLRLNDIPIPSIYGPSADEAGF